MEKSRENIRSQEKGQERERGLRDQEIGGVRLSC